MNQSRIIEELSLKPFGNKGWLHSDVTICQFGCGRSDKLGILFTNDGAIVRCMRCGESTSLNVYLYQIGRKDLSESFSAPLKDELKLLEKSVEQEEEKDQIKTELPKGFKRIYFDDYLEERGWEPEQYNKSKVGISTEYRLRHHLVFPIYQNGELVSWLARSRMSKEWHKQNIKDFKNKEASLILRYYNSEGTEFSDIVGNLDSVRKGKDTTVILVEGLFDESNISKFLRELNFDIVKCCYTFGKSLSDNQVKLLLEKGIENIVLMYDPDALKEIEKYLLKYSNKINISGIKLNENEDPGDIPIKEKFLYYWNNQKSVLEFYQTNIKRII